MLPGPLSLSSSASPWPQTSMRLTRLWNRRNSSGSSAISPAVLPLSGFRGRAGVSAAEHSSADSPHWSPSPDSESLQWLSSSETRQSSAKLPTKLWPSQSESLSEFSLPLPSLLLRLRGHDSTGATTGEMRKGVETILDACSPHEDRCSGRGGGGDVRAATWAATMVDARAYCSRSCWAGRVRRMAAQAARMSAGSGKV